MKNSVTWVLGLVVLAFLTIASVWAGDITIEPGSSIVLTPDYGTTRIYCQGNGPNLLPTCRIKNQNGVYQIFLDSDLVDTVYNYDAAINKIKSLKENHLCR